MPRIVIFNRRIDMAPDDLYLPAGIFATFRLIWMICLIITLNALISSSCDIVNTVGLYVSLHLGLCFFAVILEIWITHLSSKATVNSAPSPVIATLTQLGVISHILDWSLQIYGFAVAFRPMDLVCTAGKIPVSIGVVQMIVIWAFISNTLFFVVLFVFIYISRPGRQKSDAKEILLLWKRRIEWLLSSPEKVERKSDGQKAITQVATVFARFFKDVDWAPSDVAVGLILLKREQKIMRAVTELRKTLPMRTSFWENLFNVGNFSPSLHSDSDNEDDFSPISAGGRIPRLRSPSLRSHYAQQNYQVEQSKVRPRDMSLAVVSVENLKQNQETVTINIDSPKKVVDTDIAVTTEDVIEMVDLGEPKNGKGISPEITNQNVILGNIEARKAHNHSASTLKGDVDNIEPLPAEVPKRKSIFVSLLDFNIITSTFFEDKSSTLRKPTSSDFIRKSEDVSSRAPNPKKFNKTRSKSFSLGVTNRMTMKSREETLNNSWNFANYSFTLDPGAKDLKRSDILDVLHFSHYAYMAYVKLDLEIHKKTDILLHYSPLNDLYQSPFLVSVDHDWNTIVIAIRGTYSASDILVDLNLETEMLDPDLKSPETYKVHAGFYKSARNIVKDILQTQVLEKTLKGESVRESSYHIVVCGHSLGAGIAALVAYLLRKEGYTRTTCYGYSMPSLANEQAAEIFNDFCLSVVNGDDIVSRLSLHSCDVLKRDVARLLKNCNLPKYRVFGSALHNHFSCFGSAESRKSLLQRTQNGSIPDGVDTELQESEIEKILSQTGSLPKRWREGLTGPQLQTASTSRHDCLFVPGRILYIEKLRILEPQQPRLPPSSETQTRKRGQESLQKIRQTISDAKHKLEIAKHKSFDSKYIYTPRWASKHEFTEIIVSRTMIRDHLSVFGIMKEFDSVEFDSNPLKVLS